MRRFSLVVAVAWFVAASGARAQVIERIEPTSGPVGTVVQVIGRGLHHVTGAWVGSQEAKVLDASPSRLQLLVPDAAKTSAILLDGPKGRISGPEFRVTAPPPAPLIDKVEPMRGPPGTRVVVQGRYFAGSMTANAVSIGDRAVIVTQATPVQLEFIVPQGAQNGPVRVHIEGAGEALSAGEFEVSTPIAITGVEPSTAPPGATVTVRGSGFGARAADNRVYLNNVQLKVESVSSTELTVQLPPKAAAGKLLVDVRNGGRAFSPAPVAIQHPPTIVGFAPARGPALTVVSVRGTNFGIDVSAIEARIGSTVAKVTEARRTHILVQVPAGVEHGHFIVTVNGVGPARSKGEFEVTSQLAMSDFTPTSGPAGTTVIIRGSGFDPVPARNRVRINGRPVEVIDAGATHLEVRIPPGGSGVLEVEASGGKVRASKPFVMTTPPVVESATPMKGVVGTQVAIRGRGFGRHPRLVSVRVGDEPLTLRSVRDDLIVARVAEGARTGPLRVDVALQGGSTLEPDFVVLQPVRVTGVEPGRAAVGDAVTVRGSGFVPGAVVEFAGVAANPEAIDSERLQVRVPEGAHSGILVVRLDDGRSAPSPRPFGVD